MATDGLTGYVLDDKIKELLKKDEDLDVVTKNLINFANEVSGKDNTSVILIQKSQDGENVEQTILGNRYQIIRKIGDGGMAFVYQAKDKLLNRIVAVKVLRPEFVDDKDFLAKFKREAEAVANITHPNIVNVYDVGQEEKVHYIVMEYVDGKNLKEIIKDEGVLDEYTALDITKQIAQALSAAHKKGVIHRIY